MEAFESFITSVALCAGALLFTLFVIRVVFEAGKALVVGADYFRSPERKG